MRVVGRGHAPTRVGLVPTMGALHDGHLSLVTIARRRSDDVVVSIFVNPLQFDRAADFDAYPRPIDDDVARCADVGVDAVYAPTGSTMYPPGFETHVEPGALAAVMEGAARPGHFRGVTTVVMKLFAAVRPDVGVFGEKDFQQLAIIRRMSCVPRPRRGDHRRADVVSEPNEPAGARDTDGCNPRRGPAAAYLKDAQGELGMVEGFDVVFEMSGNPAGLRDALASMAHGAGMAILGIPTEEIPIDISQIVFDQLPLQGIYGREMYETWYKMSVMLQSGLDIRPVITHRFGYRDHEAAFAAARSGRPAKW